MSAPQVLEGALKRTDICNWILSRAEQEGRCLIGIDCNFAYAEGVGILQFGESYTYLDLWQAVEESSRHLPDYFAAAFWEHEFYGRYFWSSGPKPSHFNDSCQRLTEAVCREKGYGHPESPFKLIGPKQVGKGGLAGMRLMYDLKRKLRDDVCIWPFENNMDTAKLVLAEIYPRLFLNGAGCGSSKIREISVLNNALSFYKTESTNDIIIMSDHMTDAIISSAALRALSGETGRFPDNIINPAAMNKMATAREGWILGV
ncbi:MAG: hypothetical protein NDJ24_05540 [Alphaproteobacteria bacterium]|nr:hypothetical protein [Alphaproteobacteria bacterium]